MPGNYDKPSNPSFLDVAAERVDVAVDVVARDLQKIADPDQDGMSDFMDARIWKIGQVQGQTDGQAEVGLTDCRSDQIFVSLNLESGQLLAAAALAEAEMNVSAHDAKLLSLQHGVDVAGILDRVGLLKFKAYWLDPQQMVGPF